MGIDAPVPLPPVPVPPRSPRPAPLWLLQLIGLGILAWALWLGAHGYDVPVAVWGIVAALVLPAEVLRVLLSKWRG